MRFKDKIVLITGSAGGIGFKTALDFFATNLLKSSIYFIKNFLWI